MRARGFTLLELLIVLALMGMVAALVVPRLARTYEAIVTSGERADAVRALEALPLMARARGQALEFERGDPTFAARLAMPEGWTVRLDEALRIERSGLCHSSRILVAGRGMQEHWLLTAPACAVREAP